MSLFFLKGIVMNPNSLFGQTSETEETKSSESPISTNGNVDGQAESHKETPISSATTAEADASAPVSSNASEDDSLSPGANFFDWIKSFLFSLLAVIFIFTLLFLGVTDSGDSMLPTLENGEYLIISNRLYTPKTGDIVVVQSPHYKNGSEPLIKRIIATEGQTVKINFNTWQIWVDQVELKENYVFFEEEAMHHGTLEPNENGEVELVVKENCIFVMGDHRNDSLDSRSGSIGQIEQEYIMGRVLIRLTPFSRFGTVD